MTTATAAGLPASTKKQPQWLQNMMSKIQRRRNAFAGVLDEDITPAPAHHHAAHVPALGETAGAAYLSKLPADIQNQIRRLPTSLATTAAPAAPPRAQAPALTPRPAGAPEPQKPDRQAAAAPAASGEKAVEYPGVGLPPVSALAADELAVLGIKTIGIGDRVTDFPTATFDRVYKLTAGDKVIFTSRSPFLTLRVFQEMCSRPTSQRLDKPVRLRDVLPKDLEAAAQKSSDDIAAALNADAVILDSLKIGSRWDGHGLVFQLEAGPLQGWSFTTGNPVEAKLAFAELKAAGIDVEVVATYGNQRYVWLKSGLTDKEKHAADVERRQRDEAKAEAARVRQQAEAQAAAIEAGRRR
jgi:hypothetical protein